MPNRSFFKNNKIFTRDTQKKKLEAELRRKLRTMSASSSSWAFETLALKVGHVYEIPLKCTRFTRFSSNFVTFQADSHPKMAPKDLEKAFRGLRELHRRSRGTSEPVLEAKVVLRGSRKGGWEPSQPSQICCSVGKNEGCRPGGGIPTGDPFWSPPGSPAGP